MKVFGASPVLCVANTDAALAFYRDMLGFTVEFQNPDYVVLRLGEAGIHLTKPSQGRLPGGSAGYVFCAEIDTFFGTIRAPGRQSPDIRVQPRQRGLRERLSRVHWPRSAAASLDARLGPMVKMATALSNC
jgi:catechol 2,3-dioxygenase-like lactoylglutathione lyase family enzyme